MKRIDPILTADVIVVGAGLAGMTAAYAAHEQGARVVLVDRSAVGTGTNSAMSNGRFAGPTAGYSAQQFVQDTLETGRGLNLRWMVAQVAAEAPQAFRFLRSIGLQLDVFSDHYFYRTCRADVMRGTSLSRDLAERLRTLEALRVLTGFYVTDIQTSAGAVEGVVGFDKTGRPGAVAASAVVLATGGAGALYLRNDNQKSMMGQGYYLAARAGLDLWDMEFVQFYPIVLAETRMPSVMVYPPYPREVRLLNAAGEDIIEKYGDSSLNDSMRKKRDRFSEIILNESLAGSVKLDCREVPAPLWGAYPLSLLQKIRFDFQRRPASVLPAAHFFMGGVRIDSTAGTRRAGLFACGEAVWGLHGANRMSGNALTECIVYGRIAGRSAAVYALNRGAPSGAACGGPAVADSPPASNRTSFGDLRRTLRAIAWKCGGIVREGVEMQKGLTDLEALAECLRGQAPRTIAERRQKADLTAAVFVLRAVLTAGRDREETRGAFIRSEYPRPDDLRWRRNSCLACDPESGRFSLRYEPVAE